MYIPLLVCKFAGNIFSALGCGEAATAQWKYNVHTSKLLRTCNYILVTGFAKEVLYTHNFKLHFSPPFDRYNNRLTVHACNIAKGSTVYFYWGLIHRPVWHQSVLGWSVNGSNFPDQADSRQGITIGLAGETGHRSSYILWHVQLKTAWIEAIWP